MKARVILKLRDGSDFLYDDCYEYDDLEKAANDIADEILKKEMNKTIEAIIQVEKLNKEITGRSL